MSRRCLFLLSDTGGGHRSVAQAIAQVLEEKHSFECLLPDFFKEGTKGPFRKFPHWYADITKRRNYFWGLLWYGTYPKAIFRFLNWIVDLFSPKGLKDFFASYYPFDCVVSCHALFNYFPLKALRESPYKKRPFFIVVCDLVSLHTGWFCKSADFVFLPTKESESIFRKKGFDSQRIGVYGLPLKKEFAIRLDKEKVQRQIGLFGKKVVLIIGGGEGIGKIKEIADQFIRNTEYQIIIIAGRNQELLNKLSQSYGRGKRVLLFGFVNNMPELLTVSDLCVTKAGPATIMEAVNKRVPIILMSYAYGQEAGNVHWVESKGVGFYEPSPVNIVKKAQEILETALGEKIRRRMEKIDVTNAAEKISDKIVELLYYNRNF